MKLIETRTLATSSTSIVFSSIPQNFTDLVIKVSARATGGVYDQTNCIVSINGSSSPYYRYLLGGGSGSGSSGQSNSTMIIWSISGNITTANTFGNGEMYIHNYTSTTRKLASADGVLENNATSSGLAIAANKWESSTAINTITLTTDSGDFAAGSTVSLYGIGGVGDGYAAPKATGGIISYTPGYIVHTFFSSGTFTPNANLTDVEYLVVGGGGGGGSDSRGGAGGAGGYRSSVVGESSGGLSTAESRLSLTSGTNYTVTVGAGGSGATFAGGTGSYATNGQNSVFGSITSLGGGFGGTGTGVGVNPQNGGSGGSGGGGAGYYSGTAGGRNITQGFAGGTGSTNPANGAAGGGGAGAVGASSTSDIGGAGGTGLTSSITGAAIARAGGGGGSGLSTGQGGAGGTGGGGNGGPGTSATPGTANTGGGGGGSNLPGQAGGSGIVIVRYAA